jgi:hypothetical protein
MSNLYLVRTATAVSIAALLLGVGWMGMQSDEMQISPGMVAVSGAQAQSTDYYFPAGFIMQPNESEPEVYEYY